MRVTVKGLKRDIPGKKKKKEKKKYIYIYNIYTHTHTRIHLKWLYQGVPLMLP